MINKEDAVQRLFVAPGKQSLIRDALVNNPIVLSVCEALQIGVSVQDRELKFTEVMFLDPRVKFDPSLMIGKTDEETIQGQETVHQFTTLKRRVLDSGQAESALILTEKDGESAYLRITCVPVRNPQGAITDVLTIAVNVTQKEIEDQAKEKMQKALVREVVHRTKNHLIVLDGLITMHLDRADDYDPRELLSALRNRIHAVTDVYDVLYHSEHTMRLDLAALLRQTLVSLCSASLISGIEYEIDLDEIEIDANKATYVGMLVNEIITNSQKYAFPDKEKGCIYCRAKQVDDAVVITIGDTGIGLPEHPKENGFGLVLIEMLVQSLQAKLERSAEGGTCYRITIPLTEGGA